MDNDLPEIRETLKYVGASDIPVRHKKIIMAVLEQALTHALQQREGDWQPAETQMIADALQGRVAISWQHADELLFRLAGQLQRNPDEVKQKAVDTGFGAGVDYRLAKRARAAGENL